MSIAQRLYENGYITYMRTDATTLSNEAITGARNQIRALYGDEYLPSEPRVYRGKVKNAQEAHEAIRPAGDTMRLPDELAHELASSDERRLYDLIWKRTIACQMEDAKVRRVTTRLSATRDGRTATFQATGRTIEFPGFLRAYVEGADDPDAELDDREVILPQLAEGDTVALPGAHRVGPHHAAPGALHRGEPRQGARRAWHRPAFDVCGRHRHAAATRLRLEEGERARPVVERVRQAAAPRAALRAPDRLRVHRGHGGGARHDRPR